MTKNIRPIALYLPQFHPIPENDEWWGKGFTEWRNVVKSKPRFKGHYQPHLPADLGFYDLRLEEARLAQEAMAKEYGIYGFCYYHYWFNGKRLLNEPIDRKMKNPKEDLPFMFCWANENWTRAWDGGENEILMKQEYSEEDDIEHINALIPYFKDPRYIKVEGKPVFIIYKDAIIPDIKKTLTTFRTEATKQGLELYLCRFERNIGTHQVDPLEFGFDAGIEFQPLSKSKALFHSSRLEKSNPKAIDICRTTRFKKIFMPNAYIWFFYRRFLKRDPPRFLKKYSQKDIIIDYQRFIKHDLDFTSDFSKIYPGISPGWDNSSRRPPRQAQIFKNSTPELFGLWTREKLKSFHPFSAEENFIFINAWNEWAEGNHLEPCEKWGKAYLESFRKSASYLIDKHNVESLEKL